MNFSDVLKKSFVNSFTVADIHTTDICIVIAVTLALAVYMFFIYRILNRKNFYNKNFNISLVVMALITASVIISIQSSIVVSLGMVGALSIVRFRTAVKDPLDLVFMFWSLATGIICGVGLFEVAIIFAVVITLALFVLDWMPVSKTPMILVVQGAGIELEDAVIKVVEEYVKYYKVKSRNVSKKQVNLILEIRTKNGKELLKNVCDVEAVEHVSIIDHNGETAF